jgi:acyl carrier protein
MNKIIPRIQTIFKEKFNVEIPGEDFIENISLGYTGVGLDAMGMYYFIDFVENEFNIKFKREHFVSGVIRTLPGLCKTIKGLKT